jgi:hypothetical protein
MKYHANYLLRIKMNNTVLNQKKKLDQKKARLQQQETLLKIKARKARIRHFIEIGNLAAKAEINHLSSNMLYGAFISLKKAIGKDASILQEWQKNGEEIIKSEIKDKTPVVLKLTEKPDPEIRKKIRSHNLKWNALRQEWYRYVLDIPKIKQDLEGLNFNVEVLHEDNATT